MIDFYEGWDLRNRLLQDGYLTPQDDIADGKKMMRKIYSLAREHYDWMPATPQPNPLPTEEYECSLKQQTATTRLNHIHDIAIDWDGYRAIRSLGGLIDEIIACTVPQCRTDREVLEEVKLVKMFNNVTDFLNTRVSEDKLSFTWNFDPNDVHEVFDWCDEHGYKYELYIPNMTCNGETIGYPIVIKKEVDKE